MLGWKGLKARTLKYIWMERVKQQELSNILGWKGLKSKNS